MTNSSDKRQRQHQHQHTNITNALSSNALFRIKKVDMYVSVLVCVCLKYRLPTRRIQSFNLAARRNAPIKLSFRHACVYTIFLFWPTRLHPHPVPLTAVVCITRCVISVLGAFSSLTSHICMKMCQIIGLLKCKVWLG